MIHLSECGLFADLCFNCLPPSPRLHIKISIAALGWWYTKGQRTGDCSVHLSLNELVWAGHRYSKMIDPELKKWWKEMDIERHGKCKTRWTKGILYHSPSLSYLENKRKHIKQTIIYCMCAEGSQLLNLYLKEHRTPEGWRSCEYLAHTFFFLRILENLQFRVPDTDIYKDFQIELLLRLLHSFHFSSVAQSCPTLCSSMEWSTPGLPVHHQLPEFTQTHVPWVCDGSYIGLCMFPVQNSPSTNETKMTQSLHRK